MTIPTPTKKSSTTHDVYCTSGSGCATMTQSSRALFPSSTSRSCSGCVNRGLVGSASDDIDWSSLYNACVKNNNVNVNLEVDI